MSLKFIIELCSRLGKSYQPRSRHCSTWGRSVPSTVEPPCPGSTTVSSSYLLKAHCEPSSISEEERSRSCQLFPTPRATGEPPEQLAVGSSPLRTGTNATHPGGRPRS